MGANTRENATTESRIRRFGEHPRLPFNLSPVIGPAEPGTWSPLGARMNFLDQQIQIAMVGEGSDAPGSR
jgi:hypothetical protein